MLAKLLPERHNLYGNSLDFKLKIYERKKIPYLAFLAVPVASETALTTSLLDLSLKLPCGKMLAKFYLNFGPK